MQMLYWDAYKRVDGIWYFQKRLPMYWYATDLNKPPLGSKNEMARSRSLRRIFS